MGTTLDDAITECLAFLREQLHAEDDPSYIQTFRTQIDIPQNAQLDWPDELTALKRRD